MNEHLGTRQDFDAFVRACHERGIFVAADFVLNHVSSNHDWARRAEDGESPYERFFYWDETNTGAPWPHVADVFPEFAPGHWDYVPKRERWVWATFYKRWPKGARTKQWPAGQWDLNYREPEVLLGMVKNLLELANWGIDVFRLDAVSFLWKQRGTACDNLDEVYALLGVFRLCLKAVAPRAVMLAEWNAPARYLHRYFEDGGELAYNFPALAGLWEAVCLGRVHGVRQAFETNRQPSAGAEGRGVRWLFNECHDELNLGNLSREGVRDLSGRFWNCRGVPFRCARMSECGVCRPSVEWCFRDEKRYPKGVCGATFSLLGGPADEAAAARLRLLWLLKLSLGGTPLFFMGEEQGSETHRPAPDATGGLSDSRLVKRISLTREQIETCGGENHRIFTMLQGLIAWRKSHEFLMAEPEFFGTGSESVLGFKKPDGERTVCFLANCSGERQLALVPVGEMCGAVEAVGPDGETCRCERVCVGGMTALVVEVQAYGFAALAVGNHTHGVPASRANDLGRER